MKCFIAAIAALLLLAAAPGASATTDPVSVPDQLDFGERVVGTENYEGVTFRNRTGSDIDVHVTSALPDDFGFGLMPGSTCPALGPDTLPARSSCEAVVRFSPTAFFAASDQHGQLTVTATDPGTGSVLEVEDVHVTGVGVLPGRRLDVDPDKLRFGKQQFGSSTKKAVTLTNGSDQTLHVLIDSWAPDDFSPGQPESTCPLSHTLNVLAPGQSCTHVVGFDPSEFFQDRQTAQLNIKVSDESDNLLETHRVIITGQGMP